jgi:hypothetical protein
MTHAPELARIAAEFQPSSFRHGVWQREAEILSTGLLLVFL